MSHSTDGRSSIDDLTDDDIKCADRMKAELLLLDDAGSADNALSWALNMAFAELLRRYGLETLLP